MDSSFLSLAVFIAITIFYYLALKPSLKIEALDDPASTASSGNAVLIIYFLAVVLTQIGINTSVISSTCGGNMASNFGSAFLLTLIPWVFIFGAVMVVLIMFPGFKSAFSNVIGYFVVAGSANSILAELLVDTNLNKVIDSSTQDPNKKTELTNAAQAILKLVGNMSIMINQIVPDNFKEHWDMMKPLMKPQYQSQEPVALKQKLLDLVVTRDNIGEALWYIYTAILLVSITQYAIATRSCNTDLATMQANQAQYASAAADTAAQNAKSQSTVYTYS
jgi:hypothetical protein